MAKITKTPAADYATKRAQYQALVAKIPNLDCKGAANLYVAVNGNMFSYLHPSGAMALRLPEPERTAFLKKYKTSLFSAYGVIQKEYVTVPDELLADPEMLQPSFLCSYKFATGLKPKSTSRKQK
jgi:hypothetical protein